MYNNDKVYNDKDWSDWSDEWYEKDDEERFLKYYNDDDMYDDYYDNDWWDEKDWDDFNDETE